MVDQGEVTDLRYFPIESVDPDAPNLKCIGRFRGVLVTNLLWASGELLDDKPALESYMKHVIRDWALENWPPPVTIDTPA